MNLRQEVLSRKMIFFSKEVQDRISVIDSPDIQSAINSVILNGYDLRLCIPAIHVDADIVIFKLSKQFVESSGIRLYKEIVFEGHASLLDEFVFPPFILKMLEKVKAS